MYLQYLQYILVSFYFVIGFLLVQPNIIVMVRKIRITLKYNKITFSLFFLGILEAITIVFTFIFWLAILLLILLIPIKLKRKK